VACFDPTTGDLPRRTLDEERTVAYLERLVAAGAPSLLIAASTGHGHLRSLEELEQWYRASARAKLGGAVLTALLRPEDGDETNRKLAGLLAELDYTVAFVRPGRGISPQASSEEIAANMRPAVQAAAEAGLAVGLYSIPDVSGVPMSADVAALLVAGSSGDRIVAINGAPLRDAIDFHFHAGDARLSLAVDRDGAPAARVLDRDGPDLGLDLRPPTPSDIATCGNKCVFCFIHQLPRGMRKSLYVKDDDFRLSFLHGNYITLTDLAETDLARIEEQRLSPLYVSVHATDPELRHRLLGEPRTKRDLLPIMERLARAGIRMHAQIVLCPDWNDGPQLERSVEDLARLHPSVTTTAVVPVGLTRHRERLPRLRTLTVPEAEALLAAVHGWQRRFRAALGTRFVFAADEVYLQVGAPLPPASAYEGFPIAEDGIGLVRRFEDAFPRALRRLPGALTRARAVTVVSGEMFAPRLERLLSPLAVDGLTTRVVPIANEWFGRGIQVAGLLTGQDIQTQLAGRPLGDEVLVPEVALRDGAGVFLDDLAPADLARSLGVPVSPVPPEPAALLAAIVGERRGCR
jgi:putative radical SAM enzyme (TIGR03279 family)